MEGPGEEAGRNAAPAPLAPAAPQNGSNKIIGRNVNGTKETRSACGVLGTQPAPGANLSFCAPPALRRRRAFLARRRELVHNVRAGFE
ncbi:hypothetical protein EVAR_77703_1 [Eumeta japonica]|uniref:Uncharacterized protein n=1 Tax=Eumeta variegata TaxID=151549 RepID=A0A4C1TBP0_EUMVA|nr:hypothetical protein EVAR_77703_1 [Eumeta japonica]